MSIQVHKREERPWGNYEVFGFENRTQIKRIEIYPGHRFSLQKHRYRAEKWIVTAGSGIVTVGLRQWKVEPGSFVEIPDNEVHRMQNTGAVPLVFMEVQFGDYLGEDDIIRIEDDYGRP